MKKKVALAFSGGLDTSFGVKYLKNDKNLEVHSVFINTGGFSKQEEEEIRQVELGDLVSAEEGESIRQTSDVAEVEPSEWRDSGELEEEQEVLEVET